MSPWSEDRSPETLAWEAWRRARAARRRLLAWGTTLAAVLLTAAAVLWSGALDRSDLGTKGETLSVKLGNPEGEDLPLTVAPSPDRALQAVLSAQKEVKASQVEEARTAEAVPVPAAVPVPEKKKPLTPPKPETKQTPPASAPPTPAPVKERVIRGSEKGNATELVLKPQGDQLGQTLAAPIFLYLPLPTRVDAALLKKIPADGLYSAEERRDLLLEVYEVSGSDLVLRANPSLGQRPAYWAVLDAAGYDLSRAEYKRGRNLRAVVLTFDLGVSTGGGGGAPLKNLQLDQGSGDKAVDEAVVYAFQQSLFANGTGQTAQGRFTYSF